MPSGAQSGCAIAPTGRKKVCSSMYWPDITACEVWSEKHTHTQPGGMDPGSDRTREVLEWYREQRRAILRGDGRTDQPPQ